ncbi:MAG: hypothetical protein A2233_04685 [Candidatus Kerfeldbacteria bacterium RIFOXYA2_FULL_38_24]|uniref:Uncharacterized protein n=1 Tax=Candidatus Kerfeldbacteria bacterium RIFOXYB2_FULL_38_14 TaxID=1798547 RepID=A0A1G2BHR4_9BACT|nr:MAG: hypothetical protein A2319_02395 [Candidatus Kerfeldbacteria bacterium RIFOXYB2_FULL_38_14]OGY88168.1 MAG: hypothetical protein A2233_04685 [Candidatus Kerfeldbacteria bacterium RIFOXYA2_FULL_38_24]OGY89188.1 MAG: hypothetical protein A2458_01160 [Candidatus Kerfeldbacteria bacterium RIFOXYC2_FULL_38_9]
MSDFTPEQLNLISNIEHAFENVTREDGKTLHEAFAEDQYLSKEECLEARKLDTDTRWQDVSDEMINEIPSPFSFLDGKGRRYYLPAFMRFGVKYPNHYATSMLIYILYPFTSTQGEKQNWTVESLVQDFKFNKQQCRVIFDFLKNICEDEFLLKKPEWVKALQEWQRLSE